MALPTKKPLAWVGGTDKRPRLLGRYHVLDEIGRNAVGPLYLARLEGPKGFQRWAAIRRVDKRHLEENGYVAAFYDRVRSGAKLLHPNVCALFDVGDEDGVPWVAMEYLHGECVETAIERLEFADTPASWEIAARMIADAAEGVQAVNDLAYSHLGGMRHGDLAAHSLVVTYDGKTKIKGAFEPRAHGVLDPRKIAYAAPEQLFEGAADARADVFALGVLLWELLAGKRLFARATEDETRAMIEAGNVPPLVDIAEDVPRELDALVRRALARSPSQRFGSTRELSRELESLLVSKGVVARDDDVGRYMRTLFADRYSSQEARLQAASDITEVWRRSQHSLPASPQGPASRALAAIPDVSVRDEEDDDAEATELMPSPLSSDDEDRTTAERPAAKMAKMTKEISGYTDEIPADSGPTNPRAAAPIAAFNDTDEVPTMTAPQVPISMPPKTKPSASKPPKPTPPPLSQKPIGTTLPLPTQPMPRRPAFGRSAPSDDDTQTAPKDPGGSGPSRLIMPSSLSGDGEVTESAIFVAPRIAVPTPPDTETNFVPPPPRPMMPSFPDRPLLPSTPQAGVNHMNPWPPPPPSPPVYPSSRPPPGYAAFTPPPAFQQHAVSRGPHQALSTQSLRAVLFPSDRAKRIVMVSIVGLVGGAILFFVFFVVWHSIDHGAAATGPTASATSMQSTSIAAPPTTTTTVATAPLRTSAPPPATTIPQIPTLDLTPRRRGGNTRPQSPPPPATTHEAPPSTTAVASSGKTGFLTVMCKPDACDHVVDGSRDLGGSPLYRQELTAGKHVLTLRVDTTHAQKIVSVEVPEGDNLTIKPIVQ
ncbi:MAG TPA: protein kinase [Polyangiaceae bacterium]|nr:protein kinase [Polyangiaceae bacterium]